MQVIRKRDIDGLYGIIREQILIRSVSMWNVPLRGIFLGFIKITAGHCQEMPAIRMPDRWYYPPVDMSGGKYAPVNNHDFVEILLWPVDKFISGIRSPLRFAYFAALFKNTLLLYEVSIYPWTRLHRPDGRMQIV